MRRARVRAAAAAVAFVGAVVAAGALVIGARAEPDGEPRGLTAAASRAYVTRPDLRPPPITIHARDGETAPGSIILAPKRSTRTARTGPLIVDDDGQPIFFRQNRQGIRSNDVRVQEYRGEPVLTWWEGRAAGGHGQGVGVIVDTSYREIARVRAKRPYDLDMHEFKLTSRGTALVLIYHTVRRDLRSVGGRRDGRVIDNLVQEIDVRTGKVLFSWSSLDHIGLGESYRELPDDRSAWDYFHVNSVDEDADGNLIVSARYSNSVTKISRETGRVLWRLGGRRSDFRMGRGTRVHLAHDAEWQPDGTLRIFDNSQRSVRDRSRIVTLDVDTERREVTLVDDVRHPDAVLAATQGNAESLPGDGLFAGWGSQGRWSEFGPGGALRYDAELPDGYDSYRVYRQVWHATPPTRPDVVARRDGARTRVHVSWNGATDVTAWRLRTGSGAAAPIAGTVRRAGFETAIAVPGHPARVTVEALDAAGRVIGTSRSVAPGG